MVEIPADDVPGSGKSPPAQALGDRQHFPAVVPEIEKKKIPRLAGFHVGAPLQSGEERQGVEGKPGGRGGKAVFGGQAVITPAAADRFAETCHEPFKGDAGMVIEPADLPQVYGQVVADTVYVKDIEHLAYIVECPFAAVVQGRLFRFRQYLASAEEPG